LVWVFSGVFFLLMMGSLIYPDTPPGIALLAKIQMYLGAALERKSWLFHDLSEEQAQVHLGESGAR